MIVVIKNVNGVASHRKQEIFSGSLVNWMSGKIVVAVDQDGVLCDILTHWLSEYNEQTGENITEEDITEWDMFKFVKHPKVLQVLLFLIHPLFIKIINI